MFRNTSQMSGVVHLHAKNVVSMHVNPCTQNAFHEEAVSDSGAKYHSLHEVGWIMQISRRDRISTGAFPLLWNAHRSVTKRELYDWAREFTEAR